MRPSTALLLAAIAIVALTLWGFQPEAAAVGWHLRHGMHADGAGLRVRVPLLFSAMSGPDSLVLMSQKGRVRTRFLGPQGVLIFISKKFLGTVLSATPAPSPQGQTESFDQWWTRTSAAMAREGASVTSTRAITVAGRSAKCSQFEGGFFLVGADIWCVPDAAGGWIVDYNGPKAHVPEFYSLLDSAQAQH